MKYLAPKADLTFKKIFGNHPARLISLLNALLPLSDDEQIHESICLQNLCPNSKAYDKFWDSVSVERTLLDDRFQKGVKQGKEEGMAEGMKQGKDKLQEYTSITPYS